MKGPFSKEDLLREMEKEGISREIREAISEVGSTEGEYFFSYNKDEKEFHLQWSRI